MLLSCGFVSWYVIIIFFPSQKKGTSCKSNGLHFAIRNKDFLLSLETMYALLVLLCFCELLWMSQKLLYLIAKRSPNVNGHIPYQLRHN